MWGHRGRAIFAAVIVAAALGAHAAPAAEPCGEWGPYPPPTGARGSHNQDGGIHANAEAEGVGLFVEHWCVHESHFDGDNGGRGYFTLFIFVEGQGDCTADLDPSRDTFTVDALNGAGSLRSLAPGCEASVDWAGTGTPGLGLYIGGPEGVTGGGAGFGPDFEWVGAGAGVVINRNATVSGTVLGTPIPPGATGELSSWSGRGLVVRPSS